jgi:hypothetical protein
MPKRPAALLLAPVAVLTLAGCSTTIDDGKAEGLIRKAVTEQVGAHVKRVDCPGGKTAKKGETFTCTVTGVDGSTGSAIVTETDDKGKVKVAAPFVHTREAQALIIDGIKKQTSVKTLTVSCPDIIVGKVGATFDCAAVGDGQKATVRATQTDGKGGFRYKVLNSGGG